MKKSNSLFDDYNLNLVKCINKKPCQMLCQNSDCRSSPIMCGQPLCKCQYDHSSCKQIQLKSLIESIGQKKISTEQIEADLQTIFDQAISYIFQIRKQILNNLRFLGMSRNEVNMIECLVAQKFHLLSGFQINEVVQKVNTSHFQKIENDLSKVLYTWHLQEKYKFSFQKLKDVFQPYEDIFNQTQSIILESQVQQISLNQSQQCEKQYKMIEQQTKSLQKEKQEDDLTNFLRLGYRCIPKSKQKNQTFRRSHGN